jgi:hypothetical protein
MNKPLNPKEDISMTITSEQVASAQRLSPNTEATKELQRQHERERQQSIRAANIEAGRRALDLRAYAIRARVSKLPNFSIEGFRLCAVSYEFARENMMAPSVSGGFVAVDPWAAMALEELVGKDRYLAMLPIDMWPGKGRELRGSPDAFIRDAIEQKICLARRLIDSDWMDCADTLLHYLSKISNG